MPLDVRPITAPEHLAFLREQPSASFLQCPSWAAVKAEWGSVSLGWFDGPRLVGAGLALLRQVPRAPRYLAYLPEGPVVDWAAYDPADLLTPMVAALKGQQAFAVKMGPQLVTRRWSADTDQGGDRRRRRHPARRPAARRQRPGRDRAGRRAARPRLAAGPGRGAPASATCSRATSSRCRWPAARSTRSSPASTSCGGATCARPRRPASRSVQGGYDDLAAFHEVYVVTARRDRFTPRPLAYFQRMWKALSDEDPDRIRLYLARHEGEVRRGHHLGAGRARTSGTPTAPRPTSSARCAPATPSSGG